MVYDRGDLCDFIVDFKSVPEISTSLVGESGVRLARAQKGKVGIYIFRYLLKRSREYSSEDVSIEFLVFQVI